MRRLSLPVAALGAVLAFASTAHGQAAAPTNRFLVVPSAGYIRFDEASGIDNAASLGLDAIYHFTPMFGIGLGTSFSRPVTSGDDFLGAMYIGDTTFLYRAQQPIQVADVNLIGVVRLPSFGGIAPYVRGGVGGYTLFLDPQVSDRVGQGGRNRVQRMSINAGAGLGYRFNESVGITLDVRDMIFMNYDRERLNPVRPEARLARFIEDFPTPPEEKSTVHNIMIQLGFSFVPTFGDNGGAEGGR